MSQQGTETVKMEINGQPYYVKSKGNVPYLYDIDTNDEAGYWSSKKGQYIMFSLYNRLMKEKYESQGESRASCSSGSETMGSESQEEEEEEEEEEESSSQTEEEGEEEEEEEEESLVKTKNQTNTHSLIFLFLILFVYLIFQRTFQSIHVDFIFMILVNLLNTLKTFEMLNHD
jgi:cobalamin biosynthesis protein CobT